MLLLDALAPPIGAAIGSFAQIGDMVLGLLLAAFSGVLLAIGAGHLLPEVYHRHAGATPLLLVLTAAGAALVLVVRSLLGSRARRAPAGNAGLTQRAAAADPRSRRAAAPS